METTVTKITRVEIKNRLGQRLQLDPDEAQALSAKLPAILEDMGVKPPTTSIHGEPITDLESGLAKACPWCGGENGFFFRVCDGCSATLSDDVKTEIERASKEHTGDEAKYHAAVKAIWKREAAGKPAASEQLEARPLEMTCPWCGGEKALLQVVCRKCVNELSPEVLVEVVRASRGYLSESSEFRAVVKEIKGREAAKGDAKCDVCGDAVAYSRLCGICRGVKVEGDVVCYSCYTMQPLAAKRALAAASSDAETPRSKYYAVRDLSVELEYAKVKTAEEWLANRKNSYTQADQQQTRESK